MWKGNLRFIFRHNGPRIFKLSPSAGVSTLLSNVPACCSMQLASISLLAEQICPVAFKWSLHINLDVCAPPSPLHNPDIKRTENIISPFSASLPVQPTRRCSEAHLWAENSWYNQSWMVLVSSGTWGSGWLRLCRVCCMYCLMDWLSHSWTPSKQMVTLVGKVSGNLSLPFICLCVMLSFFSEPDMLAATTQRRRQ